MRAIIIVLLLSLNASIACAAGQAALHNRCTVAIGESGQGADVKALKQTMSVPLGDSGFLFQFTDKAGGVFSCQVCDDDNPALHSCGSMGLDLSYRPKDGEMQRLPAELDRKCTFYLQKEKKSRKSSEFIDHAIAKRIHLVPEHTDSRWVFNMELDGAPYRCVIRKSDGSFKVDEKRGDEWRPIANGILF
jgi:hypothetical protein